MKPLSELQFREHMKIIHLLKWKTLKLKRYRVKECNIVYSSLADLRLKR